MKLNNANESNPVSEQKKRQMRKDIANLFGEILETLGIDTKSDPNSKDTPRRVAKMYVDEIFAGRFDAPPKITVFPNTKHVDQLIVTGPLTVKSLCSHHMMPIVGQAWIGYLPKDNLLGLSKFPRVLDWFCRRPQIQEELTQQTADYLNDLLQPSGLAVFIKAQHFCQSHRGVNESADSVMQTQVLLGSLREVASLKAEFLSLVNSK